jgi:hypothetical protein
MFIEIVLCRFLACSMHAIYACSDDSSCTQIDIADLSLVYDIWMDKFTGWSFWLFSYSMAKNCLTFDRRNRPSELSLFCCIVRVF